MEQNNDDRTDVINSVIQSLQAKNITSSSVAIKGKSLKITSLNANSAFVTLRGSPLQLASALVTLGKSKPFSTKLSVRGNKDRIHSAIVKLGKRVYLLE
jgi:hypothetical protein